MQVLRPALLWRQARRGTTTNIAPLYWQSCRRRAQHDHHGPHKEYFQNPGQMPPQDATRLYTQPMPQQLQQQQQPQFHIPQPIAPPSPGPSRLVRASRSVLWAVLFGTMGLAAGTGLITWEYMQPAFPKGSEQDLDLLEEIEEILDTSLLVETLREDGWWEENYYAGRMNGLARGRHFVAEQLEGTQGITMKAFKHPTQSHTLMVFFLGFGIEGWPDTIHGGVITTLVLEGVDQHLRNFYEHLRNYDNQIISIDFKKPMRPGDIYAVLVPPAQVEVDPQTDVEYIKITPMVLHMEAAPLVEMEIDPVTNTEKFIIEIPTNNSGDGIHALATVQLRLRKGASEASDSDLNDSDQKVPTDPSP